MGKTHDKLKNKKESWLKTKGIEFGMKGMEALQIATVYAGLATDPNTAAIAMQEMNQPNLEHLAEANEIDKERRSISKTKGDAQQKKGEIKKTPTKQRLDNKRSKVPNLNKKEIKNDNKILVKKVEQNNINRITKKR